jgi:hypothetical protein
LLKRHLRGVPEAFQSFHVFEHPFDSGPNVDSFLGPPSIGFILLMEPFPCLSQIFLQFGIGALQGLHQFHEFLNALLYRFKSIQGHGVFSHDPL